MLQEIFRDCWSAVFLDRMLSRAKPISSVWELRLRSDRH